MSKYRILVVDDEEDLCEILQFNLINEGFDVDVANSAEEALKMNLGSYNILLLDVMMGEMSGFKMAHTLKQVPELSQIPIVFLTAKNTENDTLTGFSIGADDYISKPFSIKEVIARVKAVLARSGKVAPTTEDNTIKFQNLELIPVKKKVKIEGETIKLTKKEFEILNLLMDNPGKVYSREDILRRIWKDDGFILDRTVDVNVTRLRKKIGNYGQNIVTRQGYGYCFEID